MHHAASADGAGPGPSAACSNGSGPGSVIMMFDRLNPAVPVASEAPEVRGVTSGGLPWRLQAGSGSLTSDGHLRVRLRGLVLADDSSVPSTLRGTNPFHAFRVVVSYLNVGADGVAAVASVSTGDFQATPSGDADIEARVSIPEPCLAPVVLVTGPSGTDYWLAVSPC